MSTTVNEILQEWLKAHGYDGLCSPWESCGCSMDDLAPCGYLNGDCRAAYKHTQQANGSCYCEVKEISEIEDGHCIGCDCECIPEE